MSDLDDDATLQILKRILAGLPKLSGAACVGRAEIFAPAEPDEPDEHVEYRHRHAAAICSTCPALTECREWADSLPARDRPPGVLAGVIPEARPGRPMKGKHPDDH